MTESSEYHRTGRTPDRHSDDLERLKKKLGNLNLAQEGIVILKRFFFGYCCFLCVLWQKQRKTNGSIGQQEDSLIPLFTSIQLSLELTGVWCLLKRRELHPTKYFIEGAVPWQRKMIPIIENINKTNNPK